MICIGLVIIWYPKSKDDVVKTKNWNQVYVGMSCTVGVDYDTLVGCLWPCDIVLCKYQWSSVPRQPTSSIQGICQVQCPCPVSALFTKCAFWFYHSCKCQQMWVLYMCQIQIFGYIILIESSIFSVNPTEENVNSTNFHVM